MRVPACLHRVPRSSARRARIGSRSGQRIGPAIVRYNAAMRRLAPLCFVLGCAEWRMPPTFPQQAAGQPIVHEQALIGFAIDGTAAAVVEFLEAEGELPRLTLRGVQHDGPARTLLEAPLERARAVAER